MFTQSFHFLASLPAWSYVLAGFVIAFIVTYTGIPTIVSVSKQNCLFAMPNNRDSHFIPIPYLGGIAVFTGTISGTALSYGHLFGHELGYLIVGIMLLFFIGLMDDIVGISPLKKMLVQIISSLLIIIMADIRITSFYGLLGINNLPYAVSVIFSLFVFTLIINGINLIDGIDGLAASVGSIISITFGYWFYHAGLFSYTVLCFSMTGSLIAFLRFNVFSKRNKIFLGDTGSLVIGIIIAVIAIKFLQFNVFCVNSIKIHSAPAVTFGVLIYPLFDTLRVFILRISQGKSPFSADRQHIHHRLLSSGYSHLKSVLIIIYFNVIMIITSFTLQFFGNALLILIQLGLVAGFVALTSLRYKQKRVINIMVPLETPWNS
jgi:UDP-GlcNAc:undecaprenyl-phosphate/decaprenyl-phosphate GlcNAc-1-phosphate transferase